MQFSVVFFLSCQQQTRWAQDIGAASAFFRVISTWAIFSQTLLLCFSLTIPFVGCFPPNAPFLFPTNTQSNQVIHHGRQALCRRLPFFARPRLPRRAARAFRRGGAPLRSVLAVLRQTRQAFLLVRPIPAGPVASTAMRRGARIQFARPLRRRLYHSTVSTFGTGVSVALVVGSLQRRNKPRFSAVFVRFDSLVSLVSLVSRIGSIGIRRVRVPRVSLAIWRLEEVLILEFQRAFGARLRAIFHRFGL